RVPAKRAAQLIADVGELTYLGAAGADLHVGDGAPPCADAVQPVLVMAGAGARQVEIALAQRRFQNGRGRRADTAAAHVDPAVRPLEGAVTRAAVKHLDAVG